MIMKRAVTRGRGLMEEFLARKRIAIVDRLIEQELRRGKILDIGCGSFPLFLEKTVFAKKYGLDKSIERINFKPNFFLKRFDVEKKPLPFPDGFFTVVTMLAVLEHIKIDKLIFVLGEVYRILKKGGFFLLTTPSPLGGLIFPVLTRLGLISKIEIAEHKKLYTRSEIFNFLEKAGFFRKKIKSGFFEGFLNIWVAAER